MNFDLSTLLAPGVTAAIVLVILLTELIKKADKKDFMKGYRIYIPAMLSAAAAAILAFGDFFGWKQIPFYGALIFAVAVFGYEAILKKLKTLLGGSHENT